MFSEFFHGILLNISVVNDIIDEYTWSCFSEGSLQSSGRGDWNDEREDPTNVELKGDKDKNNKSQCQISF